jgi:ABC-type phosphate transport system auxiliary subunit
MDSTIAIVLVCGLLNVIPWVLLAYFRPDRSIFNQVEQTDEALAIVAKAIFERLESLEELAGAISGLNEANPLQSLIAQFIESRLAGNDLYGRGANGQFNGTSSLEEEINSNKVQKP